MSGEVYARSFSLCGRGKRTHTPAKALYDSFLKLGHEAVLEDFFKAVDTPFWHWVVKYSWRFMLHHPNYERKSNSAHDKPQIWRKLLPLIRAIYGGKFQTLVQSGET